MKLLLLTSDKKVTLDLKKREKIIRWHTTVDRGSDEATCLMEMIGARKCE